MDNKQIDSNLKPVSFDELVKKTNNIYDSVNIISARAKIIFAREKIELDQLLTEYGMPSDNEDLSHLDECGAICDAFDVRPKSHLRAIHELLNDDLILVKEEEIIK